MGTEGAQGGRGLSPAWHLPPQDGEWGESLVQPRCPLPQAPSSSRKGKRRRYPTALPACRARLQGL